MEKDLLEVAHRMWMQAAVRGLSRPILCLISIGMMDNAAQAALPHRNICSQDTSAEMSLEGIKLRLAEDFFRPSSEGPGKGGDTQFDTSSVLFFRDLEEECCV